MAARAREAARNVKPGLGQAADTSDLVDVAEGVETEGRCHHQYELLAALLLPMLLLLLETLAEETIISIMSSCPPPVCGFKPRSWQGKTLSWVDQARYYLGLAKQDCSGKTAQAVLSHPVNPACRNRPEPFLPWVLASPGGAGSKERCC